MRRISWTEFLYGPRELAWMLRPEATFIFEGLRGKVSYMTLRSIRILRGGVLISSPDQAQEWSWPHKLLGDIYVFNSTLYEPQLALGDFVQSEELGTHGSLTGWITGLDYPESALFKTPGLYVLPERSEPSAGAGPRLRQCRYDTTVAMPVGWVAPAQLLRMLGDDDPLQEAKMCSSSNT